MPTERILVFAAKRDFRTDGISTVIIFVNLKTGQLHRTSEERIPEVTLGRFYTAKLFIGELLKDFQLQDFGLNVELKNNLATITVSKWANTAVHKKKKILQIQKVAAECIEAGNGRRVFNTVQFGNVISLNQDLSLGKYLIYVRLATTSEKSTAESDFQFVGDAQEKLEALTNPSSQGLSSTFFQQESKPVPESSSLPSSGNFKGDNEALSTARSPPPSEIKFRPSPTVPERKTASSISALWMNPSETMLQPIPAVRQTVVSSSNSYQKSPTGSALPFTKDRREKPEVPFSTPYFIASSQTLPENSELKQLGRPQTSVTSQLNFEMKFRPSPTVPERKTVASITTKNDAPLAGHAQEQLGAPSDSMVTPKLISNSQKFETIENSKQGMNPLEITLQPIPAVRKSVVASSNSYQKSPTGSALPFTKDGREKPEVPFSTPYFFTSSQTLPEISELKQLGRPQTSVTSQPNFEMTFRPISTVPEETVPHTVRLRPNSVPIPIQSVPNPGFAHVRPTSSVNGPPRCVCSFFNKGSVFNCEMNSYWSL